MKVGDLVRRKTIAPWRKKTHRRRELGIVVSIQMGGIDLDHECLAVFYPESGRTYDIAQALMEVVSESR
jgi:hypothetical protein|tara:strand:+ start:2436 stop:2642 length:207 start_codon:yes stop_codon:yes gene_type:complete